MCMILIKGVKSGFEFKGSEKKFVITDEYGGIYVYDGKETVTAEDPFEVRCNANFENEECMKAFMDIYSKEKERCSHE